MLKALVKSARMPVKVELFRNTSRWTSFETPSVVPGFDKPRASLLSENDVYASFTMPQTPLLVDDAVTEIFSSTVLRVADMAREDGWKRKMGP